MAIFTEITENERINERHPFDYLCDNWRTVQDRMQVVIIH